MERRNVLRREIERLETRLDPASSGRAIDELATVRHGLSDGGDRRPAIDLPNLRIGFACKQRWEDMVGDDRVRACGGCDRPVFNLSSMTRDEAERVLATRGLTPCVRFFRRPDGTVMTTDCPTATRRDGRRLAVLTSSLAAGTALAAPSSAHAQPPPEAPIATPDSTDDAPAPLPTPEPVMVMGVPEDFEMGVIVEQKLERPAIEWSIWGRLGMGVAHHQHPAVLARTLTPPSDPESASIWEAALTTELTVGIARHGDVRVGAWGELRTSSGPVVGGELALEALSPRPHGDRIRGGGSVVLRAGGNAHVVTGALGFGFLGAWPVDGSWIHWVGHVVGARLVASINHSRDDPRDWSATIGLEVEPIGAVRAVLDLAKNR